MPKFKIFIKKEATYETELVANSYAEAMDMAFAASQDKQIVKYIKTKNTNVGVAEQ